MKQPLINLFVAFVLALSGVALAACDGGLEGPDAPGVTTSAYDAVVMERLGGSVSLDALLVLDVPVEAWQAPAEVQCARYERTVLLRVIAETELPPEPRPPEQLSVSFEVAGALVGSTVLELPVSGELLLALPVVVDPAAVSADSGDVTARVALRLEEGGPAWLEVSVEGMW